MNRDRKSGFGKAVYLLLILSLCVRSIVPVGLMITGDSESLFDLDIVLCDGDKGLAAIPGFGPADDHHHHAASHHPSGLSESQTEQENETAGCESCDFLWANSGFEEVLEVDGYLHLDYLSNKLPGKTWQAGKIQRLILAYQSRAPPTTPIS